MIVDGEEKASLCHVCEDGVGARRRLMIEHELAI